MRIAWNDDEAAMAFRLCSEEVRSHYVLPMPKLTMPKLFLAQIIHAHTIHAQIANDHGLDMPNGYRPLPMSIIIIKIQTILETKFFGPYYFEKGKTMIENMLLGAILTIIKFA